MLIIKASIYISTWTIGSSEHDPSQKCRQDTAITLRQTNSLGSIINEEKPELIPTQQFSFLGEDYDLALGFVISSKRNSLQNIEKASSSGSPIPPQSPGRNECHGRRLPIGTSPHAPTAAIPFKPVVHVHTTLVLPGLPQLPSSRNICCGGQIFTTFAKEKFFICTTVHGQFSDGMGGIPQRKEGGTHSLELCYIAWDILMKSHQIPLHVQHLTGTMNMVADKWSRANKAIPTEWCIDNSVFRAVTNQLGEPGVDLFATCLNKKLPVYVSPCPDPQALAIDALTMDWNNLPLAYGFPPMPILPKVLQKIRTSSATINLIASAWPTQSWFPDLHSLSIATPYTIPVFPELLSQVVGCQMWFHKNPGMYHYHAWTLPGICSRIEDFQTRLPKEFRDLNGTLPDWSMRESGQSSVLGAFDGRVIHSLPLSL